MANSIRLVLLCPIIAVIAGSVACGDEAAKYALLIAVSAYDHVEMNRPAALEFPEDDAKAVAAVFESSGYAVDLLLGSNANRKAIRDKLDALGSKGNASGVVVVGLWGHGVEFQGDVDSHFCPFDTSLRVVRQSNGDPVRNEATNQPEMEPDPASLIGMTEVLLGLKSCGAGNRLLLADCCRNSPYAPRGRAFGDKIKVSDLPVNSVALFSCSAGEKAFESRDWGDDTYRGHGAFTKCFLDLMTEMASEGKDVERYTGDLKDNVAHLVKESTRGSEKQNVNKISTGNPRLFLKLKTLKSASTHMEFVRIPPGTYMMGSPPTDAGRSENEVQHQVEIGHEFFLGIYEVTQREFKRVMGFNPSEFSGSENLPVEDLTWFDAVMFCNRLSDLDSRQLSYEITNVKQAGDRIKSANVTLHTDRNGYRLPTEAEWEYACRANTTSRFSFGENCSPGQANIWFDEGLPGGPDGRTFEVQFGPPNAFGLYQMHGNVKEWCWDIFGDSPIGNNYPSTRVYRGGSWSSMAKTARSAHRFGLSPGVDSSAVGFRVAFSSIK